MPQNTPAILEAMEQYAQQVSIRFAEWCKDADMEYYNFSELYDEFEEIFNHQK
jgi:hypothetical protein